MSAVSSSTTSPQLLAIQSECNRRWIKQTVKSEIEYHNMTMLMNAASLQQGRSKNEAAQKVSDRAARKLARTSDFNAVLEKVIDSKLKDAAFEGETTFTQYFNQAHLKFFQFWLNTGDVLSLRETCPSAEQIASIKAADEQIKGELEKEFPFLPQVEAPITKLTAENLSINGRPGAEKFMVLFHQIELRAQKIRNQIRGVCARERAVIDETLTRLAKWAEIELQLAGVPKVPSVPQNFVSAETYKLAQAMQKAKKPKAQVSNDDDDEVATSEVIVPAAPAVLPPQVTLDDLTAYNTFRVLMGKSRDKISWNMAVDCLTKLGFTVQEPKTGGNTWKFKWNSESWLRDEKTAAEIDADLSPHNTLTAVRAFHTPHQNGLSERKPLDHGRLRSFKELLEECHFTAECVSLNK